MNSKHLEGCPQLWIRVGYDSMPIVVKYLKSAVLARDYPDAKRPEIAIAGRSNAGKSSFLNCLTHSKIAKVSQEPGKTRLLNFFDVGEHYRIVDTPGYGFASRSGDEVLQWREMIETYFSTRGNLVGLILVMDIRRDWEQEEQMMVHFMGQLGKPIALVLTKSDRCSKKEIEDRKRVIKKLSGLEPIWIVSSVKNIGVKELEDHCFKEWIKPSLRKGNA